MQEEIPTYRTICNFINEYIVPNTDAIFQAINNAILNECGINLDDAYIDGTKIESVANKYTFVWKGSVEKNKAKLIDKVRGVLSAAEQELAIEETTVVSEELPQEEFERRSKNIRI